jgi:hypothetical protein
VAETETARIEVGFDGGQIMSALVTAASAEQLEKAFGAGTDGTSSLDAEDGRYTVLLGKVVYVKLFARESRVGFGI